MTNISEDILTSDNTLTAHDEKLTLINHSLPDGWEARVTSKQRLYYISHHTQTSQWLPPQESWKSSENNGLPYGWETAVDDGGKKYFINHIDKQTSADDPRDDPDYIDIPEEREVALSRDGEMGFGFVAGSEKPVVVRFVTEGGPSSDCLLPGDQILKINGEDVAKAPRERVIELVRACTQSMTMTVCQPQTDNSTKKSSLLTVAKKARLKNNPSRVRFAEAVVVNGSSSVISPSDCESYIPFMPNVLKVFLENGQTKSFKYDNKTMVKEVIDSLQEKLNISAIDHFALVLQNVKSGSHTKLTIIPEHETIAEIASKPDSQHFKCLFRVAFVPKEPYDMLQKDNNAFDYFFTQCTNDVVEERFSSDLKYDVALRLAALHIQQHHCTTHSTGKLSLKALERDTGLERFVPGSLLRTMKAKELRKLLSHFMKVNQALAPGQKQLTAIQAKLNYLKLCSQLKAFGGKCFVATFVEKKTEVMISVGPKTGISEVTNIKSNAFTTLAKFSEIESITLTKENDSMQQVLLRLQESAPMPEVTLSMLNDDIDEFLALVEGYFRLFVNANKVLLSGEHSRNNNTETAVVPYESTHNVQPKPWSYIDAEADNSAISQASQESTDGKDTVTRSEVTEAKDTEVTNDVIRHDNTSKERLVDFSRGPPPYHDNTKPVVEKPSSLAVKEEKSLAAPLASPDVSNLSTPSDSSINQESTPDNNSTNIGNGVNDSSIDDSRVTDDSVSKDSDSFSGSVSTVISKHDHPSNDSSLSSPEGGSSQTTPPMSRSLAAHDSRFGVSSFITFAGSPKSSPVSSRRSSANKMGQDTNIGNDLESVKADLDRKSQGHVKTKQSDSDSVGTDHDKSEVTVQGHSPRHKVNGEDVDQSEVKDKDINQSEMRIRESGQSESDTDSMNTPNSSPAHKVNGVQLRENPHREAERPQSFGLHSPDKLPASEKEFQALATSFGLHSPEPVSQDSFHPSYNPRLFSDGALYLDPEIIDLTLISPPKTPEQDEPPDRLIDFASPDSTVPPPGFNDSPTGHKMAAAGLSPPEGLPDHVMDLPSPIRAKIDALIQNDEDLGNQMAVIDALVMAESRGMRDDVENESDSGNETISSENIEFGAMGGMNPFETFESPSVSYSQGVTTSTPNRSQGGTKNNVSSTLGASLDLPKPITASHNPAPAHAIPGFDTMDIDAFIASMVVKPPPGDDSESEQSQDSDSTLLGAMGPAPAPKFSPEPYIITRDQGASSPTSVTNSLLRAASQLGAQSVVSQLLNSDTKRYSLDEEIAKLIIPPPPNCSEPALLDIPVVPPVVPSPDAETLAASGELSAIDILPYDSPTALEGTRLVDSLRAEYEKYEVKANKPVSVEKTRAEPPTSRIVHQRSSSVPDEKPLENVGVRRFVSFCPTVSESISSAPVSPIRTPGFSTEDNAQGPQSLYHRSGLWRPSEVRSADNSPLHQPMESLAHSRVHNSLGTLPRVLRNKKPPPPPPRRSSMLSQGDEPGNRSSDSILHSHIAHPVHQRSISVPEESTFALRTGMRPNFGLTSPIPYSKPRATSPVRLSPRAGSPSPASTNTATISNSPSPSLSKKLNLHTPLGLRHSLPTYTSSENKFSKEDITGPMISDSGPSVAERASRLEMSSKLKYKSLERDGQTIPSTFLPHKENLVAKSVTIERDSAKNLAEMLEVSRSVDSINLQAYREYKRSSSAGSAESSRSTPSDSRFQAFKSKLKSYVAPSIYKKQQLLSRNSTKDKKSDSDPHKSEYMNGGSSPRTSISNSGGFPGGSASPSSPRSTVFPGQSPSSPRRNSPRNSPRGSPRAQRHGSPSTSPLTPRHHVTDHHTDAQASPNTFRTFLGERRARLSSSGSESGPSSPHRAAGIKSYTRNTSQELSIDQVLGSCTNPTLPTSTTPTSTTSSEELQVAHDSARIPTGKVLVRTSSGGETSHQPVGRVSPWRSHSTDRSHHGNQSGSSLPKVGSTSPKIGALKQELKAKFEKLNSNDAASISPGHGNRSNKSLDVVAKEIQHRVYFGENTFVKADKDVLEMASILDKILEDSNPRTNILNPEKFKQHKDTLISHSRTFVTDSKLLVSSATQSRDKLVLHVNSSIHTLATIVETTYHIISIMTSQGQITALLTKVKDVTLEYKTTVNAAEAAAGKALSDPNMKLLMKQATTLASILSLFMRTLKALEA